MAKISPVLGLVTRAAPLLTLRRASLLTSEVTMAWAEVWMFKSMEVVTSRPPCSTAARPYLSTNKSLMYMTK